jgi:hypothetical protein
MAALDKLSDKGYGTHPDFKTKLRHRRPRFLVHLNRRRAPGRRKQPDVTVLEPVPGTTPSAKPPVRIYVGTEAAQFRAERIFVWSIMQVRDPARRYEIYWMKDLEGFDRRGWKTGFTKYRYGIPGMTGYEGRAIYNDVDQIYLSDPAELFDLDMGGASVMTINERETSVILLDCAGARDAWILEDAQRNQKHRFFRVQMHEKDVWGQMPPVWNARDWEYKKGVSKLLHYTRLHTQPWQPFPGELRYESSPEAEVWFELERSADAAGFNLYTEENPSPGYHELVRMYESMHETGVENRGHAPEKTFYGKSLVDHVEAIGRLVDKTQARTILDYGAGKGKFYEDHPGHPAGSRFKRMARWGDCTVTCYDPAYAPFAEPYEEQYDGVICTDVLEHVLYEDVPWVLDKIFRASRSFVYAVAATYPAMKRLPNGENVHCTLQPATWWRSQMEAAARRNPGVHWELCVQRSRNLRWTDRRFSADDTVPAS